MKPAKYRVLMKRSLLFVLMIGSCEVKPYQDPFILDEREIANIAAFKETSRFVIQNWDDYCHSRKTWDDAKENLLHKGLNLNSFNEFCLQPGNDTIIDFTDKGYILNGDSVFKHSIIFSKKPMTEVTPTHERRFLIKKIDTNFYYMVYIEKCAGCE